MASLFNSSGYEEHDEGAPSAWIHGSGSSPLLWDDAVEEVARLGRVIAYDRRGCTRSERPEPYNTPAWPSTRRRRRAARCPGGLAGGGHRPQLRGEVAIDLALRYPDRVRALVLVEGAALGLPPAAAEWAGTLRHRIREVAAQAGVDAVGEALISEVLGESAWRSSPGELRRMFTQNGPPILAELEGGGVQTDAG